MPIQTPADDIKIINPNVVPNFISVHSSSKGSVEDNLRNVLDKATAGTIVGGDFNVNFLDHNTVIAFAKILDEKGLKIDISNHSVNALKPMFKMRSVNSLYSQQLLKNGTPDIFLKDLSFKLVKNVVDNTGKLRDPSIPDSLYSKLNELSQTKENLTNELNRLKSRGQFNEQSIKDLCTALGVINFHNLEESSGHDHISTYYYDEAANTVFYSINSIKHAPSAINTHFKDGDKVDLALLTKLYEDLDRLVLTETYKLISSFKFN